MIWCRDGLDEIYSVVIHADFENSIKNLSFDECLFFQEKNNSTRLSYLSLAKMGGKSYVDFMTVTINQDSSDSVANLQPFEIFLLSRNKLRPSKNTKLNEANEYISLMLCLEVILFKVCYTAKL